MERLIRSGVCSGLSDAYNTAVNTNKFVQENLMARRHQQTSNPYEPPARQAVAASRSAAKAIGGAPSTAPRPERVPESHGNAYDDVRAAVAKSRSGE